MAPTTPTPTEDKRRHHHEDEPPALHTDVLEEIMSRVPMFDLLSASSVSTSWRAAVASSFLSHCRVAPCLIIHLHPHRRRSRQPPSTFAFEPHSRTWLSVAVPDVPTGPIPPPPHASFVGLGCSSHPSAPLLYATYPSGAMAVSVDPFASAWRVVDPPRVWRRDPLVARLGNRLVVAGTGACELEDDLGPVEMRPADGSGAWEACDPMPLDAATAMWLSAAAASDRMLYVLERNTCRMSTFDSEDGKWGPVAELRPDPAVYTAALGFSNGRLLLAGAGGDPERIESVTIWEVDCETLKSKEIVGSMPEEMVRRLGGMTSIGFLIAGDVAYVYNQTSDPSRVIREIFYCEFGAENPVCRWESAAWPEVDEWWSPMMDTAVFACAAVGLADLKLLSTRRRVNCSK